MNKLKRPTPWRILRPIFASICLALLTLSSLRLFQATENASETTITRGWIAVGVCFVCLVATVLFRRTRR